MEKEYQPKAVPRSKKKIDLGNDIMSDSIPNISEKPKKKSTFPSNYQKMKAEKSQNGPEKNSKQENCSSEDEDM